MHSFLRNTHLVVGLGGLVFVVTYAVSAVQMAHRFRLAPAVSEQDLSLPAGLESRALAARLAYAGELGPQQTAPQGYRVNIVRPGAVYTITYNPYTGRTHVRTETRSFMGLLNRLHHQNGLHHRSGALNAWGWALALVSLALLTLGCSGVYLWFKMHRERKLGIALLAANLLISLGLLTAMRW